MRFGIAFAGMFALAALAPARAEFSEDWTAYAEEIRTGCIEFESSLPPPAEPRPVLDEARAPVDWPRGTPARPYICLYFQFDLDADGAPVDIRTIYKGPSNVRYAFLREATKAIKKRRYVMPDGSATSYSGVVTKLVIEPVGGRYYRYAAYDFPNSYDRYRD